MAHTVPSNRLSARLCQLPHDVLAGLAARLCSDDVALQAAAEECMAAHTPLSHEMVGRVLLSVDLMPHILGLLETEDGAAAAVCSQWLAGWKTTSEPRRRLKQVPLDLPEELVTGDARQMIATPDGRLVVKTRTVLRILDRSMRVLQTVTGGCNHYGYGLIATNDDSILSCCTTEMGEEALHRFSHYGTLTAEYRLEGSPS